MTLRKYLIAFVFVIGTLLIACGSEKPSKKTTSKPAPKKEIVKPKETKPEPVKEEAAKEETTIKSEEAEEQDVPVPPEQLKKAGEIIKSANPKDIDGKKLYRLHCTICHGAKGDMKINGAKDLSISEISLEESVAQIYFGKGLMTPFNNMLSEDQIVAVAKYSETLRR